jgi:hypothetical protein
MVPAPTPMKTLPQIHFWTDRIDRDVISVHAVRGWGDRPSNGVFLLMPAADWNHGLRRTDAQSELMRRLKERERILLGWYGPRDWRNHLCDRIRADGMVIPPTSHFD